MEHKEHGHDTNEEQSSEPSERSGSERPETDGSERKDDIERKETRMEEEADKEAILAKEQVAEAVWKRPVEFVGDVFSEKLVPSLKRFLKKFGSLEDDALPNAEMRDARDRAREVAEGEE